MEGRKRTSKINAAKEKNDGVLAFYPFKMGFIVLREPDRFANLFGKIPFAEVSASSKPLPPMRHSHALRAFSLSRSQSLLMLVLSRSL